MTVLLLVRHNAAAVAYRGLRAMEDGIVRAALWSLPADWERKESANGSIRRLCYNIEFGCEETGG